MRSAVAGRQDSLANYSRTFVSDSSRSFLTLAYDPKFTERAGIEDVYTVHYGITRAEDMLLGTSWFPENTVLGKAGGILLRSAKSYFLDLPFDNFSFVFAHEYFGHGMRFREFNNGAIKYHLSYPLYGSGDSWAYSVGNTVMSYQQAISLFEGGIEAQVLLNRRIAMDWMATDEMNYRDASMYFLNFLSYYTSMTQTPEDKPFYYSPDDPGDYIRFLNEEAGYTNMGHLKMSVQAYRSRAELNIVNPFFFYSLYCFLKTYLWDGNASSGFPAFEIGKVRYLPMLSSIMTPFGIEYNIENYLRIGSITSLIDLKVGDQTFYPFWGGLSVHLQNIASWRSWSADANIDFWKQPKLMVTGSQVVWNRNRWSVYNIPGTFKGGGFGGAISIRGYYHFDVLGNSLAAVAEVGYKSVGFLEGYSLDASPVLMVGIAYRPE